MLMLCANYKNIADFLADASLHKNILIILALYVMLCVNYKEHINLLYLTVLGSDYLRNGG
jgi:hypothetical protein